MRNLILTSAFALTGLLCSAQSKDATPQLGNSSKKDTVANASVAVPHLGNSEQNTQAGSVSGAKSQNSDGAQSTTPQLSEATPPKNE